MASSISFSFPKFEPNQKDLVFQADAQVNSTGKLQLTLVDEKGQPVQSSIGRVLHVAPVKIWDKITGNVASFKTSFSFIINAPNTSKTADGLAFFLAPIDTQPQAAGGLLGLFPNREEDPSLQVVAVEFDTCHNINWDPAGLHIGVNVNGIKSVKTTPWDLANGQVADVVISYQASTKVLTASLVYPSTQESYIISSVVDLKNVLPEYVRVGFSATTGLSPGFIESHDVLSWSFESKLPA